MMGSKHMRQIEEQKGKHPIRNQITKGKEDPEISGPAEKLTFSV
jgi:hypothetical protein